MIDQRRAFGKRELDADIPGRPAHMNFGQTGTDLHLLVRSWVAGAHARKPGPSRTGCHKSVFRLLVDGALRRALVDEALHPSEKSPITGLRLREAASCAGFLARSCGKPEDLAASGAPDLRVAKFLSDREWFARSRGTPACPPGIVPIFSRKELP